MLNNVNVMQSSNSAGLHLQSLKYDCIDERADRILTGGPFWSSYWNAIIINKNGDMWILDDIHNEPTIGM